MSPELSRRLGQILGRHWVTPNERSRVISAALGVDDWDELPDPVRGLLADIGQRGATPDTLRSSTEDLDESDEVLRAGPDPRDGHQFEVYWTKEEGLARWATKPHPWRTLRRLLRKHPEIHDPEGLASHYFHIVFGMWPGERKGSNPVGPG